MIYFIELIVNGCTLSEYQCKTILHWHDPIGDQHFSMSHNYKSGMDDVAKWWIFIGSQYKNVLHRQPCLLIPYLILNTPSVPF
jgi:hypothetical protein